MQKGLIQIYYGDGKGKTTAALGQALRCAGYGFKVLYVPFLKNIDSGEFMVDLPFEVSAPKYSYGFWNELTENQKNDAKASAMSKISEIIDKSDKYDKIVLDEILDAMKFGCVDYNIIFDFIKNKPKTLELIITGHFIDEKIFDIADCITHMKKIKHHFDKGILCRKGIEK